VRFPNSTYNDLLPTVLVAVLAVSLTNLQQVRIKLATFPSTGTLRGNVCNGFWALFVFCGQKLGQMAFTLRYVQCIVTSVVEYETSNTMFGVRSSRKCMLAYWIDDKPASFLHQAFRNLSTCRWAKCLNEFGPNETLIFDNWHSNGLLVNSFIFCRNSQCCLASYERKLLTKCCTIGLLRIFTL